MELPITRVVLLALLPIIALVGCVSFLGVFNSIVGIDDPQSLEVTLTLILIGIVLIAPLGIYIYSIRRNDVKKHLKYEMALKSNSALVYKYFNMGWYIAIDPASKTIHMRSAFKKKFVEKVYSFYDIRTWKYRIDAHVYGVTKHDPEKVNLVAYIIESLKLGTDLDTGLFIDVKDVQYPEWFIPFRHRDDAELKSWFELLTQYVNES